MSHSREPEPANGLRDYFLGWCDQYGIGPHLQLIDVGMEDSVHEANARGLVRILIG